jgi:hypothetical protein
MEGTDEDFLAGMRMKKESCSARIMERGCEWRRGQGLEHF